MFRKFTAEETISNRAQAKSSVSRGIRAAILEQYPTMADVLDGSVWTKKAVVELIKCRNSATLVSLDGEIIFFQIRDGPWIPHLKFLHQWPDMMPSVTADRGAIKHILAGSDVMDPGLTSAGGKLPELNLEEGTPVALYVEGKENAAAVGVLAKSTDDIKKINDGKGVVNYHYLGDGLWNLK